MKNALEYKNVQQITGDFFRMKRERGKKHKISSFTTNRIFVAYRNKILYI